MAETRADDRRDGPGGEVAPQRTAPGDGQGRGVGARVELYYGHDRGLPTHPSPSSSAFTRQSPAGRGLTDSFRQHAHRAVA